LKEERKLRVFENMVLRRIFGPRRDEVMREWRRLHNEELQSVIKFKSCNSLLCTLLVCIRSFLNKVVKYKFSILDTYHPDTSYLGEQRCVDPWLLFEDHRVPPAKMFGEHFINVFIIENMKCLTVKGLNRWTL